MTTNLFIASAESPVGFTDVPANQRSVGLFDRGRYPALVKHLPSSVLVLAPVFISPASTFRQTSPFRCKGVSTRALETSRWAMVL